MKHSPTPVTKPFSEYSAEELAMERLFIRWVTVPEDAPIRSFWEGWLKKYPEMRDKVEIATQLVRLSSDWAPGQSLDSEEVNSLWGRIRSSIGQVKEMEPMRATSQELKIRLNYYKWYLLFVAIVILLFVLAVAL